MSVPAQPADQVFRQHSQTFLQPVVSGQSDFELLERLLVAVVARHQVGADFMLQERIDPAMRNARLPTNQKLVAGNHHAGIHVVADSNGRREIGALLLVVPKLLLGTLGEFGGVELAADRAATAACRHSVEQLPWHGQAASRKRRRKSAGSREEIAAYRRLSAA